MRLFPLLLLPGFLSAQLIPVGQPVPKSSAPPVVFLEGYNSSCTGSDFASYFGAADKLLQNSNLVTLYFDNCSVPGNKPTIEALGVAFGQFLAALKYTDGTPVTQVDAVAHSMGGLILRCYLSGKQDTATATFLPPATVAIRRAIFLASPNFGTALAGLLGSDKQTAEMTPGSQFLFDLDTWNQGSDDLRGISAIAVSGNAGGQETRIPSFDDGVVALTSSSLAFYRPGVTRVVPYCHTLNMLLTQFGYCPTSAPALNMFTTDPNAQVGQILISFLTGTNAWQSVGQAGEANPLLSTTAGLALQLRDKNDAALPLIGGSVTSLTPATQLTANPASGLLYSEALPANTALTAQITPLTGSVQSVALKLPAGTEAPVVVKPGPVINPRGVIPAAGPAPFPYDVAPGAYVSIYGTNLAGSEQFGSIPYPTQLGDVQVLVNGVAAPMVYASAGQINFVYPNVAAGLTQLTVKNSNGQNTVNVRVAPATPSIFLLDSAGSAAALDVTTGSSVVGAGAPLHAGDFVSVYLTGLGATTSTNGLDYATIQPTITIGGQSVAVLYAGRTPGLAGLDQINAKIQAGITGAAVPVVVTSNGRVSNTAFVAIQ